MNDEEILADVAEAKRRWEQETWDRMLVEAWFDHPGYKMVYLAHAFSQRAGVDLKTDPDELPRRFSTPWTRNMAVQGFICAYLPKLAAVLWKVTRDDVNRVLEALSRSKLDRDKQRSDDRKYRRERAQTRRTKAAGAANTLGRKAEEAFRDKSARRNWGAVKP